MRSKAWWLVGLGLLWTSGCEEQAIEEDGGGVDAGAPGADARLARCERDRECDDGLFCNGTERCLPGEIGADPQSGCAPGAPPCEADAECDEATDRCGSACPDADHDGQTACEGDCDDTSPLVRRGIAEECDPRGTDEDCNPLTYGTVDNDGDGAIALACFNVDRDTGVRYGGTDCNDSNSSVHPLAREVCNATADENCDGTVDENCPCTPEGSTRRCDNQTGACAGSTQVCGASGWGPCNPGPSQEICDTNVDNDCDGRVNEGCSCVDGTREPCGVGACAGFRTCANGMLGTCDGRAPAVEMCDGVDSDCDGVADANEAIAGEGVSCGEPIGTCGGRFNQCDGSRLVCAWERPPTSEVCDHRDNDCDSHVDDTVSAATCARLYTDNFECSGVTPCTQLSSGTDSVPRAAWAPAWRGDFGRSSLFRAEVRLTDTVADGNQANGYVALVIAPDAGVGPENQTCQRDFCYADGLPAVAPSKRAVTVQLMHGTSLWVLQGTSDGWSMPPSSAPTYVLLPSNCSQVPASGAAYTFELSNVGSSFEARVDRAGCGAASVSFVSEPLWEALYGANPAGDYPTYRLGLIGDGDGQLRIDVQRFTVVRTTIGTGRDSCIGC